MASLRSYKVSCLQLLRLSGVQKDVCVYFLLRRPRSLLNPMYHTEDEVNEMHHLRVGVDRADDPKLTKKVFHPIYSVFDIKLSVLLPLSVFNGQCLRNTLFVLLSFLIWAFLNPVPESSSCSQFTSAAVPSLGFPQCLSVLQHQC